MAHQTMVHFASNTSIGNKRNGNWMLLNTKCPTNCGCPTWVRPELPTPAWWRGKDFSSEVMETPSHSPPSPPFFKHPQLNTAHQTTPSQPHRDPRPSWKRMPTQLHPQQRGPLHTHSHPPSHCTCCPRPFHSVYRRAHHKRRWQTRTDSRTGERQANNSALFVYININLSCMSDRHCPKYGRKENRRWVKPCRESKSQRSKLWRSLCEWVTSAASCAEDRQGFRGRVKGCVLVEDGRGMIEGVGAGMGCDLLCSSGTPILKVCCEDTAH